MDIKTQVEQLVEAVDSDWPPLSYPTGPDLTNGGIKKWPIHSALATRSSDINACQS